jgi:uncharacterized protein
VSALAGGVLIGLASVWLLAANGRIAGVSGILHGLFAQPPGDRAWRVAFVVGLIAAGFAWRAFAPATASPEAPWGWLALAGGLVDSARASAAAAPAATAYAASDASRCARWSPL